MNASLTCCGIYICNRLQQRCPWGVYIWIFYLSPRRALWRQETCAWNIEVHVREGGIDCSPVVKFVSVVVGRHNVQQEDVFRFQVQAWHPELHLGKHLSGIGNIYLVKKYFLRRKKSVTSQVRLSNPPVTSAVEKYGGKHKLLYTANIINVLIAVYSTKYIIHKDKDKNERHRDLITHTIIKKD